MWNSLTKAQIRRRRHDEEESQQKRLYLTLVWSIIVIVVGHIV